MKSIYRIIVLGILCLVSAATHAQIQQYSDDGTQAFMDAKSIEETEENTSCFCQFSYHFHLFEFYLPEVSFQVTPWLNLQQGFLQKEIEDRLNKQSYNTFEEAQIDFFRSTETNSFGNSYYIPKLNDKFLADNLPTYDIEAYWDTGVEYWTSKAVQQEFINATVPRYSELGNLAYQGKRFVDFESFDAINELVSELNHAQAAQVGDKVEADKWYAKSRKAANENLLGDVLANKYINFYNGLSYENKIRFMTKKLAIHNSPSISENHTFGPSFSIKEQDYTNELFNVVNGVTVDTPIVSYLQLTHEEALTYYVAKEYMGGHTTRNYLKFKPNTREALTEFLRNREYKYHDGMLEVGNIFFTQFLSKPEGAYDPSSFNFYGGDDSYSAEWQNENDKDLAVYLHIESNPYPNHYFTGFDKVLFFMTANGQNPRPDFEGALYKDIFRDNGLTVNASISNQQMINIFSIAYPYLTDYNTTPRISLRFNGNAGELLFDYGYEIHDVLQSSFLTELAEEFAIEYNDEIPENKLRLYYLEEKLGFSYEDYVYLSAHVDHAIQVYEYLRDNLTDRGKYLSQQAIDAFRNGEAFDFAFRGMVYDLKNTLALDSSQEVWLIEHQAQAVKINNYLLENEWSDLTQQTLQTLIKLETESDNLINITQEKEILRTVIYYNDGVFASEISFCGCKQSNIDIYKAYLNGDISEQQLFDTYNPDVEFLIQNEDGSFREVSSLDFYLETTTIRDGIIREILSWTPVGDISEAGYELFDGNYGMTAANIALLFVPFDSIIKLGGKIIKVIFRKGDEIVEFTVKEIWDMRPFTRGRLIEEALAKTHYKDYLWTVDIPTANGKPNYFWPYFDFIKGNKVISVKTTYATSGFGSIRKNIDDLATYVKGAATNGGTIIEDVDLDIWVPEGYDKNLLSDLIILANNRGINLNILEFK